MAKNKNFSLETQLQIIEDYKKIKSAEKLSPKYGISANGIRTILHKHNVEVKGGNGKRDHLIEDAVKEYVNGEIVSVVLQKYGFHKRYFKKILQQKNIEFIDLPKSIIISKKHLHLYNNYEVAMEIYNKRKKVCDVLKAFDLMRVTSFYSVMKLRGIKIPKSNEKSKELRKDKDKVNDILEKYANNISIQKLSKEYDTTSYAIYNILKNNNVNIRPKNVANSIKNQNEEFQRYCIKRSYRSKTYTLPSGKEIRVQGYEDHFLDFIFQNKILDESDFNFEPPVIKYSENPIRKYHPDFHIPRYNLLVEIKSEYTLSRTDPRKKEAAEKNYNYIVVVDKNYTDFLLFLKNNK